MNKDDLSLEIFPNGIKLYQSEKLYKFTKDSIELAKFAKIKKSDHVLDICAGVGVVGLYAYSLNSFKKLYFVELQKDFCKIIGENINLNNLEEKSKCINKDLKDLKSSDFEKQLDVILCNPPYFKIGGSVKISKNLKLQDLKEKTISCVEDLVDLGIDNQEISNICARHELFACLDDIVSKASKLLHSTGRLYIMCVPARMCEMISVLTKYGFECKRIQINTNDKNEVNLVMFEAVLNGQVGVNVQIKQ